MKFIYKLKKFMMTRYGFDEFYQFLLYFYIGLFILNIIINSKIIEIIELFIVFIMFYRFFSKNIERRKKENNIYLKLKNKFLTTHKHHKKKYKDKKNHLYKKCPKCKSILKLPLPSKRGIQHAKCPICKNRVTLLCLRKEKIEVIKNKKGGVKNEREFKNKIR